MMADRSQVATVVDKLANFVSFQQAQAAVPFRAVQLATAAVRLPMANRHPSVWLELKVGAPLQEELMVAEHLVRLCTAEFSVLAGVPEALPPQDKAEALPPPSSFMLFRVGAKSLFLPPLEPTCLEKVLILVYWAL